MKLTENKLRSIIREEIGRTVSSSKNQFNELEDKRRKVTYRKFKSGIEGYHHDVIMNQGTKLRFTVDDAGNTNNYYVKFDRGEKNGKPLPSRQVDGQTTVTNVSMKEVKGKFGSLTALYIKTDRGNKIKLINPTDYVKQTLRPGVY